MTADPLAMPVGLPEWRHSGPYLVLAFAVHALVLAVLSSFLPDKPGASRTQALTVSFERPVRMEAPAQPHPAAAPPRTTPAPEKLRQPHAPSHTVLALAPQQVSKPVPFTVSEAIIAGPEARPSAAPTSAGSAVVSITVARYDAAYLHNPAPTYPALSRRLGEEGKVLLKVRVNPEGNAVAVNLEKSSNFERLDEAARRAVSGWRFVPAKRGDEPVEGSVIVPIVFRLDE